MVADVNGILAFYYQHPFQDLSNNLLTVCPTPKCTSCPTRFGSNECPRCVCDCRILGCPMKLVCKTNNKFSCIANVGCFRTHLYTCQPNLICPLRKCKTCIHGNLLDSNGCRTCHCLKPCENKPCPPGTFCRKNIFLPKGFECIKEAYKCDRKCKKLCIRGKICCNQNGCYSCKYPSCFIREYRHKTALKRRCPSCYFVYKQNRLHVECKEKPRHKQVQIMSKRKIFKED